jgi:hypothetical protein
MDSAIFSNQGDEYQRLIALSWVVNLFIDEDLDYVQIESLFAEIDDVEVGLKNGNRIYIQAKKNHSEYKSWSLADIKDIISKAQAQIRKEPDSLVYIYSQTPFGELNRLKERANLVGSCDSFLSSLKGELKHSFSKLKDILKTNEIETCNFLKHLEIGSHKTLADWEKEIKFSLRFHFAESNEVFHYLMRLVTKQSARLTTIHSFRKDLLYKLLEAEGFHKSPSIDDAEIIKKLNEISKIGRDLDNQINGSKIERDEIHLILKAVNERKKTILVKGNKGTGKTWVLIEIASILESDKSLQLLFIKGDRFDDISSEEDLRGRLHLEFDPFLLISNLSRSKQIVIIFDSLDALSLSRDQKPLKVFLSFIERLISLENVTVILACRDFDLDYDPLLRNRAWDQKITVEPLDFERDTRPILEKWEIDISSITENQKKILTLPQNIKLLEKIPHKNAILSISSEFQIIQLFLEETVQKNNKLEENTIILLSALAKKLLAKRSLFLPRAQFNGSEKATRILLSEGILILDPIKNKIAFSHQTLLDFMLIRSFISEDKSLLDFIFENHQLPFIRPGIRSFLFYIHSIDNKNFGKQLIEIFKKEQVAYHIKRLIAESISELNEITASDVKLISKIYHEFPDLFIRFIQRSSSIEWFDIIHANLSKAILSNSENSSIKNVFLHSLSKWINLRPEKIINCWQQELRNQKPLISHIVWVLEQFESWSTPGIDEILKTLLQLESKEKTEDRWIGKAISKYVAATGKGDELLWNFIVMDVSEDTQYIDKELNCSYHIFYKKEFLKERFKTSTALLDIALIQLALWSEKAGLYRGNRLNSHYLLETTWRHKHFDYDTYPHDSLNELLNAIQCGILYHAIEMSPWFLRNEPIFRKTTDAAIAYFLILSYLQHPSKYSSYAYKYLIRPDVLFDHNLSHEIGNLLNAIFPYISEQEQEVIQNLILDNKIPDSESEDTPNWFYESQYDLLFRIPIIFQTLRTRQFLRKWQPIFGDWPKPPRKRGWGGSVTSPISETELDTLSLKGTIKLLRFYNDDFNSTHWIDPFDHSKGGSAEIATILKRCTEKNPLKYIQYFEPLWNSAVSEKYLIALLNGITDHLRYRFGNLNNSQNLIFNQPLPTKEQLTKILFYLINYYPELLIDTYSVSLTLYALAYTVEDKDDISCLIKHYNSLSKHPDPAQLKQTIFSDRKKELSSDDIVHIGSNSVRGHIANGTTTLLYRLTDKDEEIPAELFLLLELFANDSIEGVRFHVADFLPYLEYKMPSKGWRLFNAVYKDVHPSFWAFCHRFLYHQYKAHTKVVFSILAQIRTSNLTDAASIWGNIYALSYLDELITFDELLEELIDFNSEEAWRGSVAVFCGNIDIPELSEKCVASLSKLMSQEAFPNALINRIKEVFEILPSYSEKIHSNFVELFIARTFIEDDIRDLGDFFNFLSKLTYCRETEALRFIELFIQNVKDKKPLYMWHADGLISATIQLLKWADTEDDPILIRRVINIQDRLLELDWPGINEALYGAERD